jgi:predicted membrane channel-forming protein YqfA (hemolysin III family)
MSDAQEGGGSRDVVVPMPLYKTVTVFSTLLAVIGVVGGFVLLDAAVMAGGIVRFVVNAVLSLVSLQVAPEVWQRLQPVFAVLGLAAIALGAVVYVVGSRFRAEGMGEDGEETAAPDETSESDTETDTSEYDETDPS